MVNKKATKLPQVNTAQVRATRRTVATAHMTGVTKNDTRRDGPIWRPSDGPVCHSARVQRLFSNRTACKLLIGSFKQPAQPRTRLGDRSISVAGPCLWNSLPLALGLRDGDISLVQFKRLLKTLLRWLEKATPYDSQPSRLQNNRHAYNSHRYVYKTSCEL